MTHLIRPGWLVVAIVLAALRLAPLYTDLPLDERFRDWAHLVCGGWLGAWAFGLAVRHRFGVPTRPGFYGWLALAATLVEVFAFLAGRS